MRASASNIVTKAPDPMPTVLARATGLALISLLTGCQSGSLVERPATTLPTTLKIATWNIEHLAEMNGTGCKPRTEADYADLREHVRRLEADVIALQEIENERAAGRVFPADEWVVVMSSRPDTKRGGVCRGSPGQEIRRQAVGFAIRRGIPFTRNEDVSELGLGDPDLRWGVDVTLNLPQPLRLLGVHLKSGCNAGRDPSDPDCTILFRQAPIVEKWIDRLARAGEHFAVLGDWNRRTGLANDAFLSAVNDDEPPMGRIVMTNAGRRATCLSRYTDYIDHIAVGVAAEGRLIPGSFQEYRYDGVESRFPSDHCPQSIFVRTR